MEVHAAPTRLLPRGAPPQWFLDALKDGLCQFDAQILGKRTEVWVANTFAMESYVELSESSARIILDWPQFERIHVVLDRIGKCIAQENWEVEAEEAVYHELRYYWQCLTAVADGSTGDHLKPGDANVLSEFKSASAHPDSCVWYAMYVFSHEVGHLLAASNPDLVEQHYLQFEESYLRLIQRNESLAEEIFCDYSAWVGLMTFLGEVDRLVLSRDIAWISAIEHMRNVVRIFTQRGSSMPHAPSKAVGDRQVKEWGYRSFQMRYLLDAHLRESNQLDDNEQKAADRSFQSVHDIVERALEENLHGYSWRARLRVPGPNGAI